MSLPTLSNWDIAELNEKQGDKTFGGCYSRDDIPLILPRKYMIVNLDVAKGPGTHWVMVDNRRAHECLYFDSYGMPPPERILKAMKKTGKKLKYNDVNVQDLGTDSCGWWCEYIADELKDGHDFKHVVSLAHNQPDPEKYLYDVFKGSSKLPLKFNKHELLKHKVDLGRGIFSWVKKRLHFKPREGATKRFQNFLEQEGNNKIVSVQVGKKAVESGVQKFMNLISFGQYSKIKKKLNYNDVYHNFMLITLENGKTYQVEKNHVVEAKQVDPKSNQDDKLISVPVDPENKDLNVKKLISNAEMNDTKFWQYDPETKNCQVFVKDVLDRNDIKPVNEEDRKEIDLQNSTELLNSLPGKLRGIPKMITNLAGIGDRWLHGDGVRKRKRR